MTVEDDGDQAAPPPRQRKIIHVDMDAFYASLLMACIKCGNLLPTQRFDLQ